MTTEPEKPRSCFFTFLKAFLLIIVLLVVVVAGLGFFVLDGKYEVSREITVNASPEAIHKEVGDLREWPNWLPFSKHDKSVKVKPIEQPTGVGAHQEWTSDNGNGELTFTACDPETGIEFTMVFDKKYESQGAIKYAKAGDGTRVTWSMSGQNNDFLGKWMAVAMPYMVGPMFDEGLQDMKKKVETE